MNDSKSDSHSIELLVLVALLEVVQMATLLYMMYKGGLIVWP